MSVACKVRPIGGEALLPEGYRRCEYLESTGTQYIDTGVKLSSESEVQCEYELMAETPDSNQYLFGAQTAANGIFMQFGYTAYAKTDPNYIYAYVRSGSTNGTIMRTNRENGKVSVILNKEGLKLNETFSSPAIVAENFELPINCHLFVQFSYNYLDSFFHGRIYSFSISSNSQLQLNFIPCLDDKGKPCMFDTVSRTSYYNKGTGDFLYKLKTPLIRKLPRGYQPLEYLESTSTQWIDTGIKLSSESEVKCEYMAMETTPKDASIYGVADEYGKFYLNGRFSDIQIIFYCWGQEKNRHEVWNVGTVYGNRFKVRQNYNETEVNGVINLMSEAETSGFESYRTARLFRASEINSAHTRIYAFSISRSDVLQLDFQPCLDPTGKPCMWDYVTRRPFYNQDTTGQDFLYG